MDAVILPNNFNQEIVNDCKSVLCRTEGLRATAKRMSVSTSRCWHRVRLPVAMRFFYKQGQKAVGPFLTLTRGTSRFM